MTTTTIDLQTHDRYETRLVAHGSFATWQVAAVERDRYGDDDTSAQVSLYFESPADVIGWLTEQLRQACESRGVAFPMAPLDVDAMAVTGQKMAELGIPSTALYLGQRASELNVDLDDPLGDDELKQLLARRRAGAAGLVVA